MLTNENTRLTRHIENFDEQQNIQQASHELQILVWEHDHDQWRRWSLEAEGEVLELNERVRKLETQLQDRMPKPELLV